MTRAPSPVAPTADRLAELRARLDVIDSQVHKLVRERIEIVEEIGAAKGPDEPVIRPAREAAVLENRLSAHTGAMAKEVIAYLFRAIVSSACAVQRPFRIHVGGPLEAARYLYGPVPMVLHNSASGAVTALSERPQDVAVIDAEDAERWWDAIGAAHVIGRFETSAGGAVLAIAGEGIARGAGPLALVLTPNARGPSPQRLSDVGDDDVILGRYHALSVVIPVATQSLE